VGHKIIVSDSPRRMGDARLLLPPPGTPLPPVSTTGGTVGPTTHRADKRMRRLTCLCLSQAGGAVYVSTQAEFSDSAFSSNTASEVSAALDGHALQLLRGCA
jgi:hypothetical protein